MLETVMAAELAVRLEFWKTYNEEALIVELAPETVSLEVVESPILRYEETVRALDSVTPLALVLSIFR